MQIRDNSKAIRTLSILFLFGFIYAGSLLGQIIIEDAEGHISYHRFNDDQVTSIEILNEVNESHVVEFIDEAGKKSIYSLKKNEILSGKLKVMYPYHHSFNIYERNNEPLDGKMVITPNGVFALFNAGLGNVSITPSEKEGIYRIEKDWEVDPVHRHGVECYVKDHNDLKPVDTKSLNIPFVNGDILRQYEIALIVTGEYYEANGNNDSEVISWVMMNLEFLNFIFENDLSATFALDDRLVLYRDKDTDPFVPSLDPDDDNRIPLSAQVLDMNFDISDYDIGHILSNTSVSDDFKGGGRARLYGLCTSGKNRGWSSSFNNQTLPFIETFAHEIGHMFGAAHTFNGTDGSCTDNISSTNAYEIGSGSTLMSYQGTCGSEYNIPRDFFSTDYLYFNVSNLYQMVNHMNDTDCYDILNHQNNVPALDINPCGLNQFNIPLNTPFTLLAEGSDADGDDITFCWEQFDEDGPGTPTQGYIGEEASQSAIAPIIRSFPPVFNGFRQFPSPEAVVAGGSVFEVLSKVPREINMRMTVRDNTEKGGAIIIDELLINVLNVGPLLVSSPTMGDVFNSGEVITVEWQTNQTDDMCDVVDLYLSLDGGYSYNIPLAHDLPYAQQSADVTIPVGLQDMDRLRIKVECADSECFTIFNYSDLFSITASCENEDHIICGEDQILIIGIAGTPELNLDFAPEFTQTVDSYNVDISTTDTREGAARYALDGSCQLIGNVPAVIPLPTESFEFYVDATGDYRLETTNQDFKIMNIYLADLFDVNDPCASHIASNASESFTSPGSSSTSAFRTGFDACLEACTKYVFRGTMFNDEVNMDITISGPGNFIEMITSQFDLSYTFIAVSQVDKTIIAVNSNSDFRSLKEGDYIVYGVQYENTSDPDSWIGSKLLDLIYECIGLSTNSVDLQVLKNDDLVEICDNGIDDDEDGLVDCLDDDLANDCCCLDAQEFNPIDNYTACEGETVLAEIEEDFSEYNWIQEASGTVISNTNSASLTEAGEYYINLIDSCGNMQSDTFTLTLLQNFVSDTTMELCIGQILELNGESFNMPGMYVQDLVAENGCDSTINVMINEYTIPETNILEEICEGSQIEINGEVYQQEGVYQQVLNSEEGCDSTLNISIIVIETATANLEQQICEGSEVIINGETYDSAGSYMQTLTSTIGCDSLLNIIITEVDVLETNISETICYDDEIQINTEVYDSSGLYQQVLVSSTGCDSILSIEIVELVQSEGSVSESICEGDELEINGEIYSAEGSYSQLLGSTAGCDSLLTINLNLLEVFTTDIVENLCEGDEIQINSEVYSDAGDYLQILTAENGCDSTLNISINVLTIQQSTLDLNICEGTETEVNGTSYNSAGTYQQVLEGSNGCDSILTITVAELQNTVENISEEICADSEIEINGETYNSGGTYQQLLVGVNGCDSTLNITIAEVDALVGDIFGEICAGSEFEVNGEVYDSTGNYLQLLVASTGCDSILNINLVELDTIEASIEVDLCKDSEVQVNDEVYNTAGPYQQVLEAKNGCDSILSITVIEVDISEGTISEEICASSEIQINGAVYDMAGTYQQELLASNGCDSLLTINISVLDTLFESISKSICMGDSTEVNGEIYISAGTYQQNLIANTGCDSILTIEIIEIPTSFGVLDYNLCEGDSIEINGEVFNSSGSFQQLLLSGAGCDSVLNISMNLDETYLVFESYAIYPGDTIVVNGEVYTTEGVYDQIYQTVDGCDSTVTVMVSQIKSIVHFNMDDCIAWINTQNNVYSEFEAEYPNTLSCGAVESTVLYRENPLVNIHSCTPGLNGTNAICVGSLDDCSYDKDSDKALIFEVELNPEPGFNITLHDLEFYQQAPDTFNWINGDTGLNNYPTLYGVRILVNGVEEYYEDGKSTALNWNHERISFEDIEISSRSTVRFELMGYCLIDNGSLVSAWDVENVDLFASCEGANGNRRLSGRVLSHSDIKMKDIEVRLNGPEFFDFCISNEFGKYGFEKVNALFEHQLSAYNNEDCMEGVSTLDIVLMQRHILGLNPFKQHFQYIAADINNNKEVSSVDLIELRKVILNIYDQFPNNTSWRFFGANDDFNLDNPWSVSENIIIEGGLETPEIQQDFKGIKIGDINGDALVKRSSNNIFLEYLVNKTESGKWQISFMSDEFSEVLGFQMNLEAGGLNILEVIPGVVPISSQNYSSKESNLLLSWNQNSVISSEPGEILFTIILDGSRNDSPEVDLSTNFGLQNEAYMGKEIEVAKIELEKRNKDSEVNVLDLRVVPNPFKESLQLSFNSNSDQLVELELYSLDGQRILKQESPVAKGSVVIFLAAEMLPYSGTFILKLNTESEKIVRRVIHLK